MTALKSALKIFRRPALALLTLALLGGCAANTVVPLRYQASTPQGSLSCQQPLLQVPFADKRSETITIGTLPDGKRYYPENDVSEWLNWALFEELKARGCDVKLLENKTAPAKGYVVSGSFDTVNVDTGSTLMTKAKLRLRVKLEKDGQFVFEQIYSGEREGLGLTRVDAAQKVLSSTLQYLLQDAATDVVRAAK